MNHQDRVANLNRHLEQGTLLRHDWGDGYERACLLAALAPEVTKVEIRRVYECPAEVMPPWMAHMTTRMDDNGTEKAWPAMVRRYADLAGRWHVLTPEAWEHAKMLFHLQLITNLPESEPEIQSIIDDIKSWIHEGCPSDHRLALMNCVSQARKDGFNNTKLGCASSTLHMEAVAPVVAAQDYADCTGSLKKSWDQISTWVLDAIETEVVKAETL